MFFLPESFGKTSLELVKKIGIKNIKNGNTFY